jgi:hypothetical protein
MIASDFDGRAASGAAAGNPILDVTDHTMRLTSRGGWGVAAILIFSTLIVLAGCSQKLPPRSALQLMENPAVLQGVVLRCNELQSAALNDPECRNAREAVSRLDTQQPATDIAQQQFEKAREARRARDELERRRREAREKVDPYTMPLVPDNAAAPPAAQSDSVLSAASQPNG